MKDVIDALSAAEGSAALAVIIGQLGSAYRPLGAMMAIFPDATHVGHVSSGCIEADIVQHCLSLDSPKILRYGEGSPFLDLKLPCGGGMDVLLIPAVDLDPVRALKSKLDAREVASLEVNILSGAIALGDASLTQREGDVFHLHFTPELKFCVFGNGYEARAFAELVAGAGYPYRLYSTSNDTLTSDVLDAAHTHLLGRPKLPDPAEVDAWTAITLFFHDHDLEEQILLDAIQTPAFYIGAQGSLRSALLRQEVLLSAGAAEDAVERIRGPIGLIPRVRDPKTLAISVLAEVHDVALKTAPELSGNPG